MAKICRLTEEDSNGSGPLIRSRGFSVGCNCWIIFLVMITIDLDRSRRSPLHPIDWDQRYFLILLFISIYHLSLCKSDYSRRSSPVSKSDYSKRFISALCLSFLIIWCTGTAKGRIVIFQCALVAAVTQTLVGLFSSAAPNSFQVLCLFPVFI